MIRRDDEQKIIAEDQSDEERCVCVPLSFNEMKRINSSLICMMTCEASTRKDSNSNLSLLLPIVLLTLRQACFQQRPANTKHQFILELEENFYSILPSQCPLFTSVTSSLFAQPRLQQSGEQGEPFLSSEVASIWKNHDFYLTFWIEISGYPLNLTLCAFSFKDNDLRERREPPAGCPLSVPCPLEAQTIGALQ